ncbi:MAG TPA: VWA domain-containing protein [Rhodocyclaceae bacterium]|nr:VWA domain-containing protein [Rhodocyclaceae bacterium]
MRLLWPDMLWLLLALPALAGAYVWLLRRRSVSALRYASVALVRAALGARQRVRRHVPPLLLLLAMAVAIVALARPSAVITLPSGQSTIVLAIDVSLSMSATDVEPNRLGAAQAAARAFVDEQPADVRVGIVSFAGTAALVQPPTARRADAIAAIDRLQLDRHTAIGSGIIVSLATLFPEQGDDLDAVLFGDGRALPPQHLPRHGAADFEPVAPASHTSAAIILLTDGRNTTGPAPVEAARLAAERGVRVYTVGFGTANGSAVGGEGWSIYMRFDEEALRAIADITQADYFYAGSAEDLREIYQGLNATLVLERNETELTALFTALAALLALAAGVLSLLWFGRVG